MKKKIMIAEDDEGILDSMKIMLEMYGYDVSATTDGQDIQNVKNIFWDLLLLDVWMGRSDGRKICKYLKSQADTKHIPIILVSATRDLKKSAKESGADDYLEKPFEMEELIEKIKNNI